MNILIDLAAEQIPWLFSGVVVRRADLDCLVVRPDVQEADEVAAGVARREIRLATSHRVEQLC